MALAACQALGRHRRQGMVFYPVERLVKWAEKDTETHNNYNTGEREGWGERKGQ